MPRLAISEEEKKNRSCIASIEYAQTMQQIGKIKLSKLTGIPYSTLCERFRHPDQIRIGELREICRVLRISEEDRGRIGREAL
mgnify:CR=1 FL=1